MARLRASERSATSSDVVASTPERIIEASIFLFNRNGVQNVALHRIAAHIGISPGNLAYHFPGKRQLLLAIFPLIDNGMRHALEPLQPLSKGATPRVAAEYQIRIFRTMWRSRFFFNALTYLLSEDEELRERYMQFQGWVIDTLRAVLDDLIAHRHMRQVVAPNTTELVARNMWMLWLSWLRFEQINDPKTDMVENAAVYDGALQHFSLMQPYYGKEFAAQLLGELQQALH